MDEQDYKNLQQYVSMARKTLAESSEMDEKRDRDILEYQGALSECKDKLRQFHVSFRG